MAEWICISRRQTLVHEIKDFIFADKMIWKQSPNVALANICKSETSNMRSNYARTKQNKKYFTSEEAWKI